jgi:hypothetical protein
VSGGLTLEHFFPQAKDWVDGLATSPVAVFVNGPKFGYASWEVGHILSLILIGGTTILMGLRLLGAGVTEEKPEEIYRNLRFWQNVGVIGIVVTGLLIGSANGAKLYNSSAFTVKMMCLLSGVILTYGAARPVAAANGAVSTMSKIWLAVGGAIFLAGIWVFSTSDLIDVGIYHLIVAQFVHTHFVIKPDDYDHLNPVNKIYTALYGVWIVGTALITLFRGRGEEGGPLTKLVAYSSMLVWVLGAAAGRWIAFQ